MSMTNNIEEIPFTFEQEVSKNQRSIVLRLKTLRINPESQHDGF